MRHRLLPRAGVVLAVLGAVLVTVVVLRAWPLTKWQAVSDEKNTIALVAGLLALPLSVFALRVDPEPLEGLDKVLVPVLLAAGATIGAHVVVLGAYGFGWAVWQWIDLLAIVTSS